MEITVSATSGPHSLDYEKPRVFSVEVKIEDENTKYSFMMPINQAYEVSGLIEWAAKRATQLNEDSNRGNGR